MVADEICFPVNHLCPSLKKLRYILGPLDLRAKEIENDLSKGIEKPFKYLINASLGDAQAMGQKPMTYIRQIMALVSLPGLMNDPSIPEDMKARARDILQHCKNETVGSYTHFMGIDKIRQNVADFIHMRDGYPSNWQNIILTSGATDSIRYMLKMFISEGEKKSGVMIPIPQYPLYSCTIADYGMEQINYYLDEDANWGLNIADLKKTLEEAKKHCNPRVLVIINPGNPTGQVLTRTNIEEIIKFAYDEKLFILADEVYQQNVYGEGNQFHSFKKVLMDLGAPYCNMELASIMSGSKGYMGECGTRGGYVELINLHPEIWDALGKVIVQSTLCPTIYGQILIDCVVRPPKKGDPSYELYVKEKEDILFTLEHKAFLATNMFSKFKGFKCNPIQGAMYAFTEIKLPPKAIEAAKIVGQSPDLFYSFQLLERYGINIIPGSIFGQKPDTYHIRITILQPINILKEMLEKIVKFHAEFTAEFS